MISIYTWLTNALQEEYDLVRILKESPRGSVKLIRHKATGKRLVLRRFTGNPEVYQKLLDYTCPNLPTVYEVAVEGSKVLTLEEFVEGDTMGFLLQEALFSPEETRKIVRQVPKDRPAGVQGPVGPPLHRRRPPGREAGEHHPPGG